MEQSINYAQKQEIITMKVTGKCVEVKLDDCMTQKKAIHKALAMLMGIEEDDMEIAKPIPINHGVSMTIYIYANDKNVNVKQVINDANDGELGDIFKSGWDLSKVPVISDIHTEIIESKEMRKDLRFDSEQQMMDSIESTQMKDGDDVEMMKVK